MQRQNLIACFADTLKYSQEGPLKEATAAAAASSRVYKEGFRSSRLYAVSEPLIWVVEDTTFGAAREHLGYGKTAVLNFANPHYPGGGVTRGAVAQEECLCRSSNLYPCLCGGGVSGDYYQYNREQTDYFFSDRVVYTRGVTVFKDESAVPVLLPQEAWFRVDVITCAAPYLEKRRYTNRAALEVLFCSRIRNILETAIENGVEVLILGAFGCGAFKNPPEVVARAFRRVLEETRYRNAFKRIIFAIKRSLDGAPYTACPNIAAFQMVFLGASAELEKLGYVEEPESPEITLPGGRILRQGAQSGSFYAWQRGNPYFGKQFSVLGDSICTLEGFNPRGYQVYYQGQAGEKNGVADMGDTWWGKVIGFFGGELLVNNAWSGSWVSRPETRGEQFPSGCSDRRTGGLHIGSVQPDVILVMMGVNDWGNGVPVAAPGDLELGTADTFFAMAYGLMLRKLRRNYPGAEIWCCTLARSCISSHSQFRFPEAYGGVPLGEYNRSIANAALANGCRVLELYDDGLAYDRQHGPHPKASGMAAQAVLALRQMADAGASFLDCQGEHAAQGGICRRCGKRLAGPMAQPPVLRLWLKAQGRMVEFDRRYVSVGRSRECGLQLTSGFAARNQGAFLFRDGQWYVRDETTKNGTYLNGVRLDPNREYPLGPEDVISFARSEEVVFKL